MSLLFLQLTEIFARQVFISWCSHWTLIVAWSTYIIVYLVLASGLFPEAAFVIVMIPVVIAVKFSQNNWEHFVTSILGYHRGSAPGDVSPNTCNFRAAFEPPKAINIILLCVR